MTASAARERATSASTLPSNADDPRFAAESEKDNTPAEWNARSALKAELTDPIDTLATEPRFWLYALVEGAVSAIGDLLAYLFQHLLQR
jgi:hypothetical protein